MKRPDLHRLSKPFPPQFVAKKEGADYVNHAIVQQRLLGTVGPFDMRVDQVIRGPIAEKTTGQGDRKRTWPAADDAVVGVVLTCVFTIDGQRVEVSEVGTPEGYYMAPHDGERLKKAMSDALKRCAMRVGVGLDLWSKGAYVLPAMLAKDLDAETGEVADDPEADAPEPDHDAPDPDEVDGDAPEKVDLAPLEAAIHDATLAGVKGDFDAMRAYALQDEANVAKAIAKLHAAIEKKKSGTEDQAPTDEAGEDDTQADPAASTSTSGDGDRASSPAPNPCSTCGPEPREQKCPDCPADELPWERADRLGISAADQTLKIKELAAPLKATVPARRQYVGTGKCHPGLTDAFVAWLDEVEAGMREPVGVDRG